jgi:ELWxxDGT repeat protein
VAANLASAGINDEPLFLCSYNGLLHFNGSGADGRELWATDGTVPGTGIVVNLHPSGSSWPDSLTVYNGLLYFGADDGSGRESELWATDGSAAGTTIVVDLIDSAGSSPYYLFVY